jgi:NADPH:quinone reductase-like Zn-dependent oxidoreductase
MRALRYASYGGLDRYELGDAPEPTRERGRILVRVRRAALNPKDALIRKGKFRFMSGRKFPKLSGLDFSGEVLHDATGELPAGTRVFGALDEYAYQRGTLAEIVSARPRELARLPEGVDFDHGAAIALCGSTALQALRDRARLSPGAAVLIHGASGGLGTAALQIARLLGAKRIASVSSARNLELCRSLGATQSLDYAKDDFLAGSQCEYECIFDAYGTLSLDRVAGALSKDGVFVSAIPTPQRWLKSVMGKLVPVRERLVIVKPNRPDLDRLASWMQSGALRPVIDSRHPLERWREAFTMLESKRARGKIVIEVA